MGLGQTVVERSKPLYHFEIFIRTCKKYRDTNRETNMHLSLDEIVMTQKVGLWKIEVNKRIS